MLEVRAPEPRAKLAALWRVRVGMKIKIAPPVLWAAATARAKVKIGADGRLVRDHRMDVHAPDVKADVKGKVGGKLDVKAPDIKGKVDAKVVVPDVKGKLDVKVRDHRAAGGAAVGGGVKAGADAKAKAGATVKAGVNVKVNVPKPPPPPSIKVEGKVKASGGFKIGN
jgi:hypothetical protein